MTAWYKKDWFWEWINAYTLWDTSIPLRPIWYYYDNLNYSTKYSISVWWWWAHWNLWYGYMTVERLLSSIECALGATNMPFWKQWLIWWWCIWGTYDCYLAINWTPWNDWASLWIR